MAVSATPQKQKQIAWARQCLVVVMSLGLAVKCEPSNTSTSNMTTPSESVAATPRPEVLLHLGVCRAHTCIDPDADLRAKVTRSCGTVTAPTGNGVSVENLCGPGYYCDKPTKSCLAAGKDVVLSHYC